MCEFGNMLHVFSRALLCVVALCCGSLTVQAQSSDLTSTLPEPLWTVLLQATADLPTQIDALKLDYETQVTSLQDNNARLISRNSELENSNASLSDRNLSLEISNLTLTRQNADLASSLKASQADLATSEAERKRLESALSDSLRSITKAQDEAKKLVNTTTLLRIGCWTLGILAVGESAYIVGHALKWW